MDWNSCALIWRVDSDGDLSALVVDVEFLGKFHQLGIQIRLPGGKSRDHPEDRNPLDTLIRELREELGLVLKEGIHPDVIEQFPGKDGHLKVFFLLHENALSGTLRTTVLQQPGSITYPPRWVKLEILKKVLYKTHEPALQEGMKALTQRLAEY